MRTIHSSTLPPHGTLTQPTTDSYDHLLAHRYIRTLSDISHDQWEDHSPCCDQYHHDISHGDTVVSEKKVICQYIFF